MRTPETIRNNPFLLKLYRRAPNKLKTKWKSMSTIPILLELYRNVTNEKKTNWNNTQNSHTHNIWTKEQNSILKWTLGNNKRTIENQQRLPRTPKQTSQKKSSFKQTPLNQATHKHATKKKNTPQRNKIKTPNDIVNEIIQKMKNAAQKTLQRTQKMRQTAQKTKSQRMKKAAEKTLRTIQMEKTIKYNTTLHALKHKIRQTQTQTLENTQTMKLDLQYNMEKL